MADARSDAELIAASLADPRAFGAVFERHYASVHGYLARRAGRMVADELAGEVFCIAFRNRDRYDTSYAQARPWLLGIATRLCFRAARQSERARRAYSRADATEPSIDDGYDDVERRMDVNSIRDRLTAAIDALAPRDRDALLLFAWEEMTYTDVARALDIPIGTVRVAHPPGSDAST